MNYVDILIDKLINFKDKQNPETNRKGKFFVASFSIFIILGLLYSSYSFVFNPQLVIGNIMNVAFLILLFVLLYLYQKFQIRVLIVNIWTFLMFSVLYDTYQSGGGIFSLDNIWCVIFPCWVFLVANKASGILWFGYAFVYYIFLFYAERMGFKNFRNDISNIQSDLTLITLLLSTIFMGLIIYLHEKGKEKYMNAMMLAKAEIEEKNKELEIQKQDIISSITYARRIQSAILPQDELISNHLTHSFIIYKPKNIVSGDFYFVKQVNEFLFVAAADCTGHGVPGSLMSILGLTILNELVTNSCLTESNIILDQLRERIKISLKQTGKIFETRDGMDIALCVINTEQKKIQFSGANNNLIQIRNGLLVEHKGDRMPIGIFPKERPFGNVMIEFSPTDSFYLYSDGFIDQFGGTKSEKFKIKLFKELLLKINYESPKLQKEYLENAHREWKGTHEQTDDILIIGFRYS